MAFNAETAQNVEVSVKLPPELAPMEQLRLMERYTETHKAASALSKEEREVACLRVLYPALLRSIEPQDLIAGRLDFLPIGFGCVTSVGGVGHYCVFHKLTKFKEQLPQSEHPRVDALYAYWLDHDLKTKYCKDALKDDIVGMFIDCDYPLIATARLSGMMLDYRTLMKRGIGGLRSRITALQKEKGDNAFYRASLECLDLFGTCCDALKEKAQRDLTSADAARAADLCRMIDALDKIKSDAPETFYEALQLFWLYALLAGVINYGRMDDVLGTYLKHDFDSGLLNEDEAFRLLRSLWTMIENRRTTVNGRIITGGRGRRDPEAADTFTRIAMKVAQSCRYVEPQFTLRMDRNTPEDIFDAALDTIGQGATYPTLYNDDVNVPAVMHAMRVDETTAEQYVPFGCGEFVIQGQSTGTPNTCINLLKLLQISLNGGIVGIAGLCLTLMIAAGNPLQAEDYGIRSLSACILGGLTFGGWGSVACAVFGSGFFVLISNTVYYIFTLLSKLIPGFAVSSYWQNFVSDVIIFLGLPMTIVTAKGQREALRAGIVRQVKRVERYDKPAEDAAKGGNAQ